jgi:hypothetical protein
MFKIDKTAAELAIEFAESQKKLKTGFIKKIEDLIETQRFKIAGYLEAEKNIQERRIEAQEQEAQAEKLLKELA